MPNAAKVPPQIAPGILCPKCKSPMLDERQNKRSDKSPDYTCSNMLCFSDASKKYRTAIWAPKDAPKPVSQGHPEFLANQEAEDAAELAGKIGPPKKPTMREAYKQLTEWTIAEIVPLYDTEWGEGVFPPEATVAIVATLFIQACKSGKVE